MTYIILGILQGIFEWIPISSEGIVALAGQLSNIEFNVIDVALFAHMGTLFAALIYFRRDWLEILTLRDKKLAKFLIIATLISLAVGFFTYKTVRSMAVGAGLLFVMGFALLVTSFFQKTKRSLNLNFDQLALVSGFLQGLSVIPGLSRSGSTIFALSLGKIAPSQILRISYIMSVPAVFASTAYLGFKNPVLVLEAWPILIFSFLTGFAALHFLIKLSEKINFSKFAFIFGILCLVGALINLKF